MLKPTHLETLKALFKKLGYDDRASQIMTSTLRPPSINLYESHWQRFVEFCRQKKTHVFQVPMSGMRLARSVTRRTMPQWDLYLVLSALMRPPFASARARPTDANIELKWRTLKMCFLLAMATARRRSFIHALSVAPAHITFGRGDVDGQSTASLLPEPGFFAKNQLPSQVPRWVMIPGIDHLHPDDCERMLCPVRQLHLYLNDTRGVHKRLFIHWNPSVRDIL